MTCAPNHVFGYNNTNTSPGSGAWRVREPLILVLCLFMQCISVFAGENLISFNGKINMANTLAVYQQ